MSSSSDAEPSRELLARYALGRRLGGGGQATTYEAVDKKEGRLVAVKEFRVRGASSWKDVELAEREARVLKTLSHPGLPRFIDHFEENGRLYLVMEKIEGENLVERQKRGMSANEVLAFLHDAADILDYLHDRSPPVIHRDIKPANVIQRPDGSFALVDFGAVRDRLQPEGGSTVVGTYGFMAPEQFQGRALPVTDVYAVGATALSMLTGSAPEALPHRGLGIDVPASLRSRANPELGRILTRMLEPDPDRRAHRIRPLLDELPEDAVRDGRPRARTSRAHRTRRRSRQRSAEPLAYPLTVALYVLFRLGLGVAQLGVAIALQLVVPVILTILSLVISPRLRGAARSVRAAGKAANRALQRAQRAVGDSLDTRTAASTSKARAPSADGARMRVEHPAKGARVDDWEEELDELTPDERARRIDD